MDEVINDFSEKRDNTSKAVDADLIRFFKQEGLDEMNVYRVIKKLYEATSENEVIIRSTAGKVLSNLTEVKEIQNFSKQEVKKIYLDTQILLYATLINFDNTEPHSSKFYTIILDLYKKSISDSNLILMAPGFYVSEVSFQIKQALMLIPFQKSYEDFDSVNIYYQFYSHIRIRKGNEYSFEKFMYDMFKLKFSDLARFKERQFIEDAIIRELDKNNIKYQFVNKYEDYSEMIDFIHRVSYNENLRPKSNAKANADGWMINYLSDEHEHDVKPIFITWDGAFEHYRNEYMEEYQRDKSLVWHQFSPGRFLTLVDLSSVKFSGAALNSEIMGIIDQSLMDNTRTIYDVYIKFIDAKNNTDLTQREYFSIVQEAFEGKFESQIDSDFERKAIIASSFDKAITTINSAQVSNTFPKLNSGYDNLFREKRSFKKLIDIIVSHSGEESVAVKDSGLIKNIVSLIEEEE